MQHVPLISAGPVTVCEAVSSKVPSMPLPDLLMSLPDLLMCRTCVVYWSTG